MRMNRLVLAALVGTAACRGFPGSKVGNAGEATRVALELQDIRYDGQALSGRLLVSAVEGSLRLDKRLIESIALPTKSVSDCETGQPVEYLVIDVLAPRPREEDVLTLQPGYWYGKEVRIPLFTTHPEGPAGPACIEAEFAFHALGGAPVARVQVRAVRASPPAPDVGTPTGT